MCRCVQKKLLPCGHALPLALTFSVPCFAIIPKPWAGGFSIYVPFRGEHFPISYFLHLGQLWVCLNHHILWIEASPKIQNTLQICVPSLCKDHANFLCILILVYVLLRGVLACAFLFLGSQGQARVSSCPNVQRHLLRPSCSLLRHKEVTRDGPSST